MFVMRAFTPKGPSNVLADPAVPTEVSSRDGMSWEDRVLRCYYQDIGAVPRLCIEEERRVGAGNSTMAGVADKPSMISQPSSMRPAPPCAHRNSAASKHER